MLLQIAHEQLAVDEGIVTQSLDPMWVPSLEDYGQHDQLLAAMLRTASYYVLDVSQAEEAIDSMPPALPSFPPLPFRRIWIEMQGTDKSYTGPVQYAQWDTTNEDGSNDIVDVLGIAINEVVRGREWQIFMPLVRVTNLPEGDVKIPLTRTSMTLAFHLTPTEILGPTPVGKTVKQWNIGHHAAMLQMAINGAMLITARGVHKTELQLPRAQRKRLARERWAPRMPKLYYVDLDRSGEEGPEIGKGRIYHVRWLVSGHWRHVDTGDSLCTCWDHRHSPRVAKYIDPYVKGPAGAPWIGRPVHRKRGETNG